MHIICLVGKVYTTIGKNIIGAECSIVNFSLLLPSFLILKVEKSKEKLIAVAFKSKKEQQLSQLV